MHGEQLRDDLARFRALAIPTASSTSALLPLLRQPDSFVVLRPSGGQSPPALTGYAWAESMQLSAPRSYGAGSRCRVRTTLRASSTVVRADPPMPVVAGEAPQVTVVIPTRDRPGLLAEAVECAVTQRGPTLEVVVVDDGSVTPVTLWMDIRAIIVLRLDESRGDAAARNTGLAAARGTWTAFLDDDDLWAPDKLLSQLQAVREVPGAGYAYCSAIELDGLGGVIKDHPAPDPAEILELLSRRNVMPAGSSNVIARTALLRELGGFDTSFANLSDWDMWLRLLHRGTRMSSTVGQRAATTISKLSMSFRVLRFSHGVAGSMRSVKLSQRSVAHSSGVVGNSNVSSTSPYIFLSRCGTGV